MDVFTLSSGYGLWPCQSLSVHTKNPQPQVEGMFELFKILFFHFLSFNSFHRTAFVIAALRASVMRQLESVALWAQGNCGGCKISIATGAVHAAVGFGSFILRYTHWFYTSFSGCWPCISCKRACNLLKRMSISWWLQVQGC